MRPLKGVRRHGAPAQVTAGLPRRDPAPSRAAYRLHRLWLRPRFRKAVCLWLPLAACLGLGALWVTAEGRMAEIEGQIAAIRSSIEERPEFMVSVMAIDGASPELAQTVRDITPVDFPISSFDLDLDRLRDRIEGLDGVKAAQLRIRAGGVLEVRVTERIPAVIWRHANGLALLDADGVRVREVASRADYANLPLIVGEGADAMVPQALELFRTAAPIRSEVLGLVRISEMRWDMVLEDRKRIMLPEIAALDALDRVIALHEAQDLLGRDVTHVDMRNGARPTLRISQQALSDMRRARKLLIATDED